jgi:dipeptidyl aminopeptidase/acylaminoacyl peptidase
MRSESIVTALLIALLSQPTALSQAKKSITVEDIINTTRWADVSYFWGNDPEGNIAQYSPDGQHFVITLRRANLTADTNDYSVYLFTTSGVFQSPQSRVLLTMSSGSNSPAIAGIKWLSDNKTLAFAGVRDPELPQVYTVNIDTGRLIRRTNHRSGVDQFDISPDGKRILFTTAERQSSSLTPEQHRHGVVIENQTLEDIISGNFNQDALEEHLFYQENREEEIAVPATHQINENSRISFSPDGRFATVTAFFRTTHPAWTEYNSQTLKFWGRHSALLGGATPVSQYFLFDCSRQSIQPLLNAPAVYTASSHWANDSHAIYLKTLLPIEGSLAPERSERVAGELPAEISVPSLALKRITGAAWQESLKSQAAGWPEVTLKEDPNTSPAIFATDRSTRQSIRLIDLNPQFSALEFGRVEDFHLRVHGIPVVAGMYLPPGYSRTKPYPLVLQTHGYDPKRFSMDGRDEWSSGFAARALAAAGIIVVQMEAFENPADHDKVGNDRTLGPNRVDSFRNFSVDCYSQAIQSLDAMGVIDPNKIGISGFSRTVWFVAYMLTHTKKQQFRTAILTDGIDGGYFAYIADRDTEFDDDNGGKAPFGKDGLRLWLKESPGFNLDRVDIPVRLVSIGDRLSQWEWFSTGKMQRKPIELIEIPGGSHMVEKPMDRYIAMQGIVDWFRFWLQDYEDPRADKRIQYDRWKRLKAIESGQSNTDFVSTGTPTRN